MRIETDHVARLLAALRTGVFTDVAARQAELPSGCCPRDSDGGGV